MTLADVTALSGDPLATMDEAEWAEDMINRLDAATPDQQRAWFNEMTVDEADMVIAAYRTRDTSWIAS